MIKEEDSLQTSFRRCFQKHYVSSTPGDWMAVACRSWSFQNSTRKVGPSTPLSFWSWLRAHSISTAWFPTCSGSRTTKSRLGTQHQSEYICWRLAMNIYLSLNMSSLPFTRRIKSNRSEARAEAG
ncbi:uncharacterized protein LOC144234263 [Crocuta crocuta]